MKLPPAMKTPEVHAALAECAATGDVTHRNRVVVGCMQFVVHRARRFSPRRRNFDDIIQAGCEGLMRAIETYDPTRAGFLTYAAIWIDRYIIDFMHAETRLVKQPRHDVMALVARAVEDGAGTTDDVVEAMKRTRGVNGAIAPRGMHHDVAAGILRLITSRDLGEQFALLTSDHESADDAAIRVEMEQAVHDALADLSVRQRETIDRLFWREETRRTIAADYGVTGERIRQITNVALERLRKQLREVA